MKDTVVLAIIEALNIANKNLTVKEIKELILKHNLYIFGTTDIDPVIRKTIDRHCINGAKSSQKSKIDYFIKKDKNSFKLLKITTKKITKKTTKNYGDLESGVEGKKKCRYTTYYERKPKLRRIAIELHGKKCIVCGFDFEKKYGEYAKDLIHIHHIKPLFENDDEDEVLINPKTDLVPVCPNCHAVIHKKKDKTLSIEEIKLIIKK